jgi:hypothetical protein
MTANLSFHFAELEQRVAVSAALDPGLRPSYGADPAARADFDAVCRDATKLRAHLQGVRIECEYAEGGH